jgi:signal transduction histidine kinase
MNLYRIVEEALTNVRMHSGARHARVVLQTLSSDRLVVMVEDDGRGVEVDVARPVGLGTVGMRERAMLLGGELRIEGRPGIGTRVYALFPRAHVVPAPPELVVRGA